MNLIFAMNFSNLLIRINTVNLPGYDIERQYWSRDQLVAGIDEAGRGCIAGPVVAAAVVLKDDSLLSAGIDDSKKLSESKRDSLFELITSEALCWSVGIIDNEKVDEINILNATFSAMHLAIDSLDTAPVHLLIDGNRFKSTKKNFTTIVGGDAKVLSIAAASIVAKVTRDQLMKYSAHGEFPVYGFNKHKGYGTKLHYEMIAKHGICRIHRQSFLKNILNREETLF